MGKCSNHNGMVNRPLSNELMNSGQWDENDFDILSLIGLGISDLSKILGQVGVTTILKEGRIGIHTADFLPSLCPITGLFKELPRRCFFGSVPIIYKPSRDLKGYLFRAMTVLPHHHHLMVISERNDIDPIIRFDDVKVMFSMGPG